jgi:hypothetical protein
MTCQLSQNAFATFHLATLACPDSKASQLRLIVVLNSVLNERNVLGKTEVDNRFFVRP